MTSCSISIHQFSAKIMNKQVYYQVYHMKESLLLWIGLETDPSFQELALAMSTPYEKDPTTTQLLGALSATNSSGLAGRLCKKCKKQVFVSCNISDGTDSQFLTAVEERLVEEMKMTPDAF